MDAQRFADWLHGWVELTGGNAPPTVEQWKVIREHLDRALGHAAAAARARASTASVDLSKIFPSTQQQWAREIQVTCGAPVAQCHSTVCAGTTLNPPIQLDFNAAAAGAH